MEYNNILSLVVGSADCSLLQILDTLLQCKYADNVISKWVDLAEAFSLKSEEVKAYRNDLISKRRTYKSVFRKLLERWKQKLSDEATLGKLLTILVEADLSGAADCLRKEFNLPPDETIEQYMTRLKIDLLATDIREFIDAHHDKLERCTDMTDKLLEFLPRDIWNDKNLEALRDIKDGIDKSWRFYHTLRNVATEDAYKKVITALYNAGQPKPVWMLRSICDEKLKKKVKETQTDLEPPQPLVAAHSSESQEIGPRSSKRLRDDDGDSNEVMKLKRFVVQDLVSSVYYYRTWNGRMKQVVHDKTEKAVSILGGEAELKQIMMEEHNMDSLPNIEMAEEDVDKISTLVGIQITQSFGIRTQTSKEGPTLLQQLSSQSSKNVLGSESEVVKTAPAKPSEAKDKSNCTKNDPHTPEQCHLC